MAENLERIYNIPLRKESAKAPFYIRAAKTIIVIREFLERHMKSQDVKIGKYLNQKILERGRSNIPHHVLVKAVKDKDGIVKAELVGAPEQKPAEIQKKAKKEEIAKPLPEKLDVESVKKEKEEEEKKKVLEHPVIEKKKSAREKKEVTSEVDEEMRKKGMVKRKDKKEMISK